MSRRFFTPLDLAAHLKEGRLVSLADQEAHHLMNVMRAKAGDEVVLFDGAGAEFSAKIAKTGKRAVELELIERREISRESSTRLTLGVALPKGDRQQWLCEKLVELGCEELVPLIARYGVAEPVESALTRLRRFVIEASKQCGRNRLMQIGEPQTVNDFLNASGKLEQRLFLNAGGQPLPTEAATPSKTTWRAAIGPEGGWSEQEITAASDAGWTVVSLGKRILRVETAAAAITARLCLD